MPDNPWNPITWPFHYKPRWQGPLSGRYFEKQTEDALNALYGLLGEISGGSIPSDAYPRPAGTAAPGTSTQYSRGDHVHPAQVDISGNAETATRLSTARAITLTGAVAGEGYFDGAQNITIPTTAANATTSSAGLMSAQDKTKLDGIASGANNYVLPQATSSTLGGVMVDTALSSLSTNPVQNNVVKNALDMKAEDSGVVHTTGNESISGQKTFTEGPYGTTSAVSASAINLGNGVVFTKTIAANTTITITGVPTSKAATFNLILTNGGAYTVTWPSSVKWSGGTAPELTASGEDVLTFMTPNGGTTWYGTVALAGAA